MVMRENVPVNQSLALPGRPEAGAPCHLEPLTEMLGVWHQRIQEGRTTKEAVRWDCLKWVASHDGDDVMKERCEIKDIQKKSRHSMATEG